MRHPTEDERCNPALLEILRLPALEKYQACVRERVNTTNMSAVGADVWVKASCWCEYDVRTTVEQFSCCSHRDFRGLCQVQCGASCAGAQVQQCMEDCPAMCLERDYAFEDCQCSDNNCYQHMLCIAERGMNRTHSGEVAQVCDDNAFESSDELRDYHLCLQEQPLRTVWHRANGKSYCACRANLQAAATRHHCCGARWARSLCASDTQCLAEQSCSTPQATQCLDSCATKCRHVRKKEVTGECYEHCLSNTSTCRQYLSCKPREPLELEYLCTNGRRPSKNGCCRNSFRASNGRLTETEACPLLCDHRQKYHRRYGPQCQCSSCPNTTEQIREGLKEKVVEVAVARGQILLHQFAKVAGLEFGPSGEMQELMIQRNRALKQVTAFYVDRNLASLELAIAEVCADWNRRILAEAWREKACQEDPARRPARCPDGNRRRRRGKYIFVVMSLVFGACTFLLLVVIFIYWVGCRKQPPAQPNAEVAASGAAHLPNLLTSRSNIVMGCPLEGSRHAVDGSPVQGKVAA